MELVYEQLDTGDEHINGIGDLLVSTKYRFWRKDSLALQESAAVLLKIKLNSGSDATGTNTTDWLAGFTYGYESIKWYRWASVRYRFNQDKNGLERGNRTFIDLLAGYRPRLNGYRDPDMVYMVELNGEFARRNKNLGVSVADSGGSQWFVSPGFMWTVRNLAIKGGVQIPVYSNLNGSQQASDYRIKLSLEWHL